MKEVIHKIDAFNDKIEHLENSTKIQIEHTRSEMGNKIRLLKWLILSIGGVITILLTLILIALKY